MKRITDQEFIEAWHRCNASPMMVAKDLDVDVRSVYSRRAVIESKYGHTLHSKQINRDPNRIGILLREYHPRALSEIEDGIVIVFSDAHYLKGRVTPAHKALVKLCKELKPKMVVANGDILDGATISSHSRIGWEQRQSLKDELEEVTERLGDIEAAVGGNCRLHRTIGNHDIRFDRKLATQVGEYEGIKGMALSDHIPRWTESWSLMLNSDVMIKHRWHNGVHAQWNNVLKAGIRAIVTGHLHRLMVTAHGDYSGRKWGVDSGTLADIDGPQFLYTEDNPTPWASGFVVLTFYKGMLMPPELCEVVDGIVWFRGQPVEIDDGPVPGKADRNLGASVRRNEDRPPAKASNARPVRGSNSKSGKETGRKRPGDPKPASKSKRTTRKTK